MHKVHRDVEHEVICELYSPINFLINEDFTNRYALVIMCLLTTELAGDHLKLAPMRKEQKVTKRASRNISYPVISLSDSSPFLCCVRQGPGFRFRHTPS